MLRVSITMNGVTTAFWGMTINNYDETDLAMVHNGYPDHMRELVHTLEVGETGTPHVQAFIKLQRQQRLSFVKKLFPRGNFKALTSDEYMRNAKSYAQKLDGTAAGAAVHSFMDPMKTIENVMRRVILKMIQEHPDVVEMIPARRMAERDMVIEDYKNAKIFVSSVYMAMWKHFGHEMYQCVFNEHTHTHTHSDDLFSHEVNIPTDAEANSEGDDQQEDGSRDGADEEGANDDDSGSEASDDETESDAGSSDKEYSSEED